MPYTLGHGDLHLGNVALVDDHVLLFDWTDAAVTFPALDIALLARSSGVDDIRLTATHPGRVRAGLAGELSGGRRRRGAAAGSAGQPDLPDRLVRGHLSSAGGTDPLGDRRRGGPNAPEPGETVAREHSRRRLAVWGTSSCAVPGRAGRTPR